RYNLANWEPSLVRERGRCPHASWVWSVALSADGRTALTGSTDKTARLWDAATAEPLGRPLEHALPVWAAVFSPDGTKVLTATSDWDGNECRGHLWDVATGKELLSTPPVAGRVTLAAFLPDGEAFLVVGSEEARAFRTDGGRPTGEAMKY